MFFVIKEVGEWEGISFPETGVYFAADSGDPPPFYTKQLKNDAKLGAVPIEEQFIPSTIQRADAAVEIITREDLITADTVATYGAKLLPIVSKVNAAVDKFNAGKAIIIWNDCKIVVQAKYRTNNDGKFELIVTFTDSTIQHKFVQSSDGIHYEKTNEHYAGDFSCGDLKLYSNGGGATTQEVSINGADGGISIWGNGIIINSATPGSYKRFKITVDDNGTLSATEVTS